MQARRRPVRPLPATPIAQRTGQRSPHLSGARHRPGRGQGPVAEEIFDITPTFRSSANEPATFDCYIDDALQLSGCDQAGHETSGTRPFLVTPRFTIARTSKADEGSGADKIVIRRDGGNGTASVKVSTTLAGTAKSPADFTAKSITVTFTVTQTTTVMPLSIVNDRRAEGTETSGVRLSSPVNGLLPTPTRKVSLKDND